MSENLGIDLNKYPSMLDLVVKAIKEPIPDNWGFIKNSKNQKFVINLETQEIQNQKLNLEKLKEKLDDKTSFS